MLQVGFHITLENHHITHANSKLTNEPNYPQIGIEGHCLNEIITELCVFYAIRKNQYKFKYQTIFSARFDKQGEDNQVLDETQLFNNLKKYHKITKSDFHKIEIKSPLENQIQQQEMKESGRRFEKITSRTMYFL